MTTTGVKVGTIRHCVLLGPSSVTRCGMLLGEIERLNVHGSTNGRHGSKAGGVCTVRTGDSSGGSGLPIT